MTPTPPPRPRILTPSAMESLVLDTSPWLSCDECFSRMDTYAEAVVRDPAHVDPGMSTHLRGCAACHDEAESLVALIATAASGD